MNYTCLIIDDESIARDLILEYVHRIPELECISMACTALEAKTLISELKPDLIFLDIEMPDLSGIELLQIIKHKPATILTTAYSDFALEAFDLDVCDYLLKPVEFNRFYKATLRGIESLNRTTNTPVRRINSNNTDYIFVKSDNKLIKVNLKEILYIEGYREYVRIFTEKAGILTLQSLSKLMDLLSVGRFFRIHRSFIVNVDHIDNIEGNVVQIGKKYLKISKGQKEPFLNYITQ